MKKLLLLVPIAFAAIFFSFKAAPTSWKYDSAHAKVGFSVTHMMISDVEGFFKKATATLTTTNDDFTDAVVEMNAEVSSIFTDNDARDGHLQNADFFDAPKFPTITFKSTSFKKAKEANTYIVKGNLTMHGVTKMITLNALARTGTNPMNKKTVAGFKISGAVNRLDFGIGTETSTAMISNEVLISSNVEFVKE